MARRPRTVLRTLTSEERAALAAITRAGSERADRVARAKALLAVASGAHFIDAAKLAGRRSGKGVAHLVARFNAMGLAAVDGRHGGGPPLQYGATERERILREFRRTPDREQDGTATWSLTTLQRALREAPDGLPQVSTWTILLTLWEAGYTWQKSRTWCHTGVARRKRKDGTVVTTVDPEATPKKGAIDQAYRTAEPLGIPLWCQDEAGPYQPIPQSGASWQRVGQPARQPHEYIRGGTVKLLTLFRPATGEVRAEPVERVPNTVLHPWLQRELEAILAAGPPAPSARTPGRHWAEWDWHPGAEYLDSQLPPIRLIVILDNLKGHHTPALVQWCAERGILLLYTPIAGSWLNLAESVQRILVRRALAGQHPETTAQLRAWLADEVRGWNAHPTPFAWGGKRAARRQRARERRHALGGSGGYTRRAIRRKSCAA